MRAAAQVIRKRPDCRFWILGEETTEKGARARLESLFGELNLRDRVTLLGWRTDVPDVLRGADLVAVPSLNEGLPLAILEAMACGRPVVATPVGGVPEAVQDGVTGVLVPPGDPESLATAILTMLADTTRLETMGTRARALAEERFSLDRVVERVQMLYDELLAHN